MRPGEVGEGRELVTCNKLGGQHMKTLKRAQKLCVLRSKLREWSQLDVLHVGEDEARWMQEAALMMEELSNVK